VIQGGGEYAICLIPNRIDYDSGITPREKQMASANGSKAKAAFWF
jgi:hypothetical protein